MVFRCPASEDYASGGINWFAIIRFVVAVTMSATTLFTSSWPSHASSFKLRSVKIYITHANYFVLCRSMESVSTCMILEVVFLTTSRKRV